MDIVQKAQEVATEAHADQFYGDKPYTYHLRRVAEMVHLYTKDPVGEAVAWLHDILEDTSTSYRDLDNIFGETIADAVLELTEPCGPNRMTRQLYNYHRIRGNNISMIVKLCDRMVNMQESKGSAKGKMYLKEYERFKFALFVPDLWDDLWDDLDAAYDELKASFDKKKKDLSKEKTPK